MSGSNLKTENEDGLSQSEKQATPDSTKESYQNYKELGGIINEGDYQSALARAKDTTELDIRLVNQSELIAKVAKIELNNMKGSLDQRTILYGVLRSDKPQGVKYHHCQMSDQRLFAEVLRMLGDVDSLDKLINAHPNIFIFVKKTV